MDHILTNGVEDWGKDISERLREGSELVIEGIPHVVVVALVSWSISSSQLEFDLGIDPTVICNEDERGNREGGIAEDPLKVVVHVVMGDFSSPPSDEFFHVVLEEGLSVLVVRKKGVVVFDQIITQIILVLLFFGDILQIFGPSPVVGQGLIRSNTVQPHILLAVIIVEVIPISDHLGVGIGVLIHELPLRTTGSVYHLLIDRRVLPRIQLSVDELLLLSSVDHWSGTQVPVNV